MLDKVSCTIKSVTLEENSCDIFYKIIIPRDELLEESLKYTNVKIFLIDNEEVYDNIADNIKDIILGNFDSVIDKQKSQKILNINDDDPHIIFDSYVEIHKVAAVRHKGLKFLSLLMCPVLDLEYIQEQFGIQYSYDLDDLEDIKNNSDKIAVFSHNADESLQTLDSRIVNKTNLVKINEISYNSTKDMLLRSGKIIQDIRKNKYTTRINGLRDYTPSYVSELFHMVDNKKNSHYYCIYDIRRHIEDQAEYNALYRKLYDQIKAPTIREVKVYRRRTGDWDYKNKATLVSYYDSSITKEGIKIYSTNNNEEYKYIIHFIDSDVLHKTVGLYEYEIEIVIEDHIREMIQADVIRLQEHKEYFHNLYYASNRRENYFLETNSFTPSYIKKIRSLYPDILGKIEDIRNTLLKYATEYKDKRRIENIVKFCVDCTTLEARGAPIATPETLLYNYQIIDDLCRNISYTYGIILNKNTTSASKASGRFVSNIISYNKKFRNTVDIDALHYETNIEYLKGIQNGYITNHKLTELLQAELDKYIENPNDLLEVPGTIAVTPDAINIGAKQYAPNSDSQTGQQAFQKGNKNNIAKAFSAQDAIEIKLKLESAAKKKNSPSSNSGGRSQEIGRTVSEVLSEKFGATVRQKTSDKTREIPEEKISSQTDSNTLSSVDKSDISYRDIPEGAEKSVTDYITENQMTIDVIVTTSNNENTNKEVQSEYVTEYVNNDIVLGNMMQLFYFDITYNTWVPMKYNMLSEFARGSYIIRLVNVGSSGDYSVNYKINKHNEYFVMQSI